MSRNLVTSTQASSILAMMGAVPRHLGRGRHFDPEDSRCGRDGSCSPMAGGRLRT
jgi:hypothetical protein